MIYGYAASLEGQTVGDIDLYARKLLNELAAIRRTDQACIISLAVKVRSC